MPEIIPSETDSFSQFKPFYCEEFSFLLRYAKQSISDTLVVMGMLLIGIKIALFETK